jgi:hypothetical protein
MSLTTLIPIHQRPLTSSRAYFPRSTLIPLLHAHCMFQPSMLATADTRSQCPRAVVHVFYWPSTDSPLATTNDRCWPSKHSAAYAHSRSPAHGPDPQRPSHCLEYPILPCDSPLTGSPFQVLHPLSTPLVAFTAVSLPQTTLPRSHHLPPLHLPISSPFPSSQRFLAPNVF